jgi:integrase
VPLGVAGSLAARKAWAVVSGHREAGRRHSGHGGRAADLFDAGPIKAKPTGKKRSDNTVKQYRWCLPAIRKRFAASKYGKTEYEASRGEAICAADVQRFVKEAGSLGKKYLAILKGSFDNGIREGLTTYNPMRQGKLPKSSTRARGSRRNGKSSACPRWRRPVLSLMMAFEAITAWRISDIIGLRRVQLTPAGVRRCTRAESGSSGNGLTNCAASSARPRT